MICARNIPLVLMIFTLATAGSARGCIPPERPFLPQSVGDMRTYAALIRNDFETYFAAAQDYFRCLDEERAQVFAEAREVSAEYGRFVDSVE